MPERMMAGPIASVPDHVCSFCSRRVFTDGTVDLGCGYCGKKTRADIERELRPFKPLLFAVSTSDFDLLDYYAGGDDA